MFISDWSSDVCSSDLIKDKAKHVAPYHLLLARGGRLSAKHVIDARGAGKFPTLDCGWQKFVGQALTVKGGHGVEYPVVMDASVEQRDGSRFVYLLPFAAETLFVEDTYSSNDADLYSEAVRERLASSETAQGWAAAAPTREGRDVCPGGA